MRLAIRLFLLLEGASFVIAALVHAGILASGFEHQSAAIAESIIGAVLLIGLVLTWVWSAQTYAIGLAVQAFGLLGTLVGLFMVAIGIGPRTIPDIVYHVLILAVLAAGVGLSAFALGSIQLADHEIGELEVAEHFGHEAT